MIWTTQPPTGPGMYWWRFNRSGILAVIQIIEIEGVLEVCEDWWMEWAYSDLAHGEWSSEPISEPEEPA